MRAEQRVHRAVKLFPIKHTHQIFHRLYRGAHYLRRYFIRIVAGAHMLIQIARQAFGVLIGFDLPQRGLELGKALKTQSARYAHECGLGHVAHLCGLGDGHFGQSNGIGKYKVGGAALGALELAVYRPHVQHQLRGQCIGIEFVTHIKAHPVRLHFKMRPAYLPP